MQERRRGRRVAEWAAAWSLGIGLALVLAATATASPRVGTLAAGAPRMLNVTQTVEGVDDPASTLRAVTAAAVFSANAGLRQGTAFREIEQPQRLFAALPVTRFGAALLTDRQIVAAAQPAFEAALDPLRRQLHAYLQAQGLVSASFTFDQQIQPAGAVPGRTKRLVWTLLVDGRGRAQFAAPRIEAPQPAVLYAVYVSRRLDGGLPLAWAYPEAGQLKWQLRSAANTALTGWTVLDTGGAFDAPATIDDAPPVDPDRGARCLIDRASDPACPPALPDVRSLLDATGADYALLDYARALTPVYDEVEVPPGSGQFEARARAALSVDRRRLVYPGCEASDGRVQYTNEGTFGFEVRGTVDRYLVDRRGGWQRTQAYTGSVLSPTAPYARSLTLPAADARELAARIIDPLAEVPRLIDATDVANLIALAPLTTDDRPTQEVARWWMASGLGLYYPRAGVGNWFHTVLQVACNGATGLYELRLVEYLRGDDVGRDIDSTQVDALLARAAPVVLDPARAVGLPPTAGGSVEQAAALANGEWRACWAECWSVRPPDGLLLGHRVDRIGRLAAVPDAFRARLDRGTGVVWVSYGSTGNSPPADFSIARIVAPALASGLDSRVALVRAAGCDRNDPGNCWPDEYGTVWSVRFLAGFSVPGGTPVFTSVDVPPVPPPQDPGDPGRN